MIIHLISRLMRDLSSSISLPVPCLRAGLFIYLYLFWSLWKCATPSRRLVSVAICAFVLVVVDRAVEPVERVTCLDVAIASSSRHGRNAEHVPSLVFLLFLLLLFACLRTEPSSRLGKMVERSIISIVGSSRRDRDAERNSFPVISCLRCATVVSSYSRPSNVVIVDSMSLTTRLLPAHSGPK